METVKEINNGFKHTKIGWIPEDWKVSSVNEVFNFLKTNSLSRSQLIKETLNDKSIFNIHYGDIHTTFKSDYLNIEKVKSLPKIKDDNLFKSNLDFLKDGDLILADASEDYEGLCDCVEIRNVKDLKLISGLHTFALRDKDANFFNGYKAFVFKSSIVSKSLKKIATGISVLGVSKSNLSKIIIPIPPILEQKKIAEILFLWDTSIEQNQKLLTQLKTRKKGLMQQLLSGKKRLSGFSGEWEDKKIGNIASHYSKKNKLNDNIEVLSCTKYEGLVPSLQYFGRKVYGDDLSKYKIVPNGYFAYATNHIEEGSIGFQNIMKIGLVSPMYTVFKTINKVDDSFLFRLLKTDRMIYKYQSNMSGSIARRGGLRWNAFETIHVQLPSLDEQKAISNILQIADNEINQQEAYLKKLQKQKKGLMQVLLTGNKRVKI